jgi:hypothetical protein
MKTKTPQQIRLRNLAPPLRRLRLNRLGLARLVLALKPRATPLLAPPLAVTRFPVRRTQ